MFARVAILFIASGTLLSVLGSAEESASISANTNATGTSLESFRIISERNIFNQNRSSRSARREETAERRAPVVQSISLVGTMSYAKGDFAFFEGTRPEYKKPVKIGDWIAGYEVKEIKPDGVKIANETNHFEIRVGQQLRRVLLLLQRQVLVEDVGGLDDVVIEADEDQIFQFHHASFAKFL